jgi:hypothetical protein
MISVDIIRQAWGYHERVAREKQLSYFALIAIKMREVKVIIGCFCGLICISYDLTYFVFISSNLSRTKGIL